MFYGCRNFLRNFIMSDDNREILEALNRGSLKNRPGSYSGGKETPQADRGEAVKEPALLMTSGGAKPITIGEAVPGQVTREEDGEFLLIKHNVAIPERLGAGRDGIISFAVTVRDAREHFLELSGAFLPEKALFLDIETCGLTANPLFLIGVAYFNGADFSLLQLFARDYDEERPLLSFFNRFIGSYEMLVTYNGKSFDIPFILSRGHENRIRIAAQKPHLDLLIEARRRWKKELPDCKLQTIERRVLKFERTGDIPGVEIPQAYHEYVRTGDASVIQRILEHNVRDIVSLVEIMSVLTSDFKTGEKAP